MPKSKNLDKPEAPEVTDCMVWWLFWKNWVPYKPEDALKEFWDKAHKIMMRDSWYYQLQQRKK